MTALTWLWDHPRVVVGLLLVFLAFAAFGMWKLDAARRDAEARAASADERAQLAAHDQPVAIPVDTKALQKEAEALRKSNQALASAYSAELAEVHLLRAVLVARGSTGPVVAHGTTIPADTSTGGQGGGVIPSSTPLPTPGPRGRTLLAEGDTAEIRTDIEIDETDKRNLLLNVTASAVRLTPTPSELIIDPSLVKQKTIHIDPVLVEGPTVTKTRWWLVGVAGAVGFGAGAATCRVK